MKVRTIELFAGYGSQHLALKRLKRDYPEFDFEAVAFCEIDKHAITAYRALHGEQIPNLGDITKVDPHDVPDCDLMTWSFPCGLQGTLVKTLLGYCDIKDIKQGDIVLTHKNRYRKVLNVMEREVPSYYEIRAVGCRLHLTGEHPLLVLRKNKQQWVRVCDLQKTDLISYNIPVTIDKFKNIDDSLLWLLGRYVSDGWIDKSKYNSIEFSIGNTKTETFDNHINNLPYKFHKVFKKGCIEYRVADKELQNICFEFGIGAKSKKIPQWLIDMPSDKITSFLDGYFSGDGHVRYRSGTKVQMFTTVSKELFLGLQNLLIKSYGKVCSLTIRHDARKVSFSDTYNGQIALSSKTLQRVTGDKIFVPIKHINYIKDKVKVYNISVDDDESYTCDNVISHNCTDISSAGQQKGLAEGSDTRSSLCWDAMRIFEAKRPKYLLMENVSALVSQKFIEDFNKLQLSLQKIGYTNFFKLINAKDMGVPQNRLRIFMVSILDCHQAYYFPKPFPLTRRLKDVLEQNVDERYYLSDERVAKLMQETAIHSDRGNGFAFRPHTPEEIASTVKCSGIGDKTDNFVAEPKVEIIADLQPDNKRPKSNVVRQQNMLVGVNGLSPCIPATHTKHEFKIAEPAIIDDVFYDREPRVYDTVSPTIRSSHDIFKVAEPQMLGWTRNEKGEITDRHPVSVANCVTAAKRDNTQNYVMVPSVIELPVEKAHQQDAIQHEDGISRCLVVGSHGNGAFFTNTAVTTPQGIRIRRLCERELYRLMDVSEPDIDTLLAAPIPRTQHCRLAGNSIVVACLYHIFRNLFVDTEPGAGTQTKLF